KETDKASKARLEALEKELSELNSESATLRTQWETEKKKITDSKQTKQDIEELKHRIEEAERAYDLETLAKLKYGELPALEKKLEEEKQALADKSEDRLLKEEVDVEEIAEVVSQWTGIPVSKLVESEREKLLKLPE
ncbi:type VI secretion system ATPase TssH, partial [Priestia megaterium]|nr:type VI secretion system ATPase TssH [Priestia megaterium]